MLEGNKLADGQLHDNYRSTRRTTSFGEWTRAPETKGSRRIDAICNLRGVSIDAAQKEYTVRLIKVTNDWKNIDVGSPSF